MGLAVTWKQDGRRIIQDVETEGSNGEILLRVMDGVCLDFTANAVIWRLHLCFSSS